MHWIQTVQPVMKNLNVDLDAIVLGITGKTSSAGGDSWNAGSTCCWPPADGAGPDDVTYIPTAIGKVCAPPVGTGSWPCDPKRIFVYGHSAGSAMTYRLACDHADLVASAFTMSTYALRTDIDPACSPSEHVSIAHFHGTSDTSKYDNSTGDILTAMATEYVSVEVDRTSPTRTSTVSQMKTFNSCAGSLSLITSSWLDFDSVVGGSETDLYRVAGCPTGIDVEVWKANGTAHVPTMTAAGYTAMVNWFKAHVKP